MPQIHACTEAYNMGNLLNTEPYKHIKLRKRHKLYDCATIIIERAVELDLMFNVLGVYHNTHLYIAGYLRFAFCNFSILEMFDGFAMLY